jgi:hypothetical protein
MDFPRVARIRKKLQLESLQDIPGTITEQLIEVDLDEKVKPGMEIAITVGSRGITNIPLLVKSVVAEIKKRDATPFVIPAMGSHGGATAEGQVEVLHGLGVTEASAGCEIRSSMDVVEIGQTSEGTPVYVDQHAYHADGIIIMGRVKPHTDFQGKIASGLLKMASIGIGKHKQALVLHSHGVHGIRDMMPEVGKLTIAKTNVLCGIAIVENALEETAMIQAVRPEQMEEEEEKILEKAASFMPALPVDDIDVLIVDEIGKNHSGTGMDTNIIGRMKVLGAEEPDFPKIKYVIASDLSEASHGNALGVGLADLTTRRLFDKIDFKAMNENVITSTFLERGKIPLILDNDKEALRTALRANWSIENDQARIVRIPNTLHINELYVSEPVFHELKGNPDIEVLEDLHEMNFDENGYLLPM